MISASLRQATILWNSAFSCFWPCWSVQTRFVAKPKLVTEMPLGVVRTSGSCVMFPMSMTLLRSIVFLVSDLCLQFITLQNFIKLFIQFFQACFFLFFLVFNLALNRFN